MAKIILSDVDNLDNPASSKATINANSAAIEVAIENTLSRDGTTPNQMGADFDMNSHRILNLPPPAGLTEPLRLQDLSDFTGGTGITHPGGSTTQVQYNNAGSFAGITGATTNGTTLTLVAPALGTPVSLILTNATGLPVASLTGTGTGVLTALAVNVGTAGSVVVNGGALGTPLTGTLTNCTGLPISAGVTGLGTGVATFLATPTSANLRAALTDEVGTGAAYFVGGALGTPASVTLTNATGLPLSGLNTQAAFTIVANNTSGAAVPTAVDIAALSTKTPAGTDYVLISDQAASGAFKKALVSSIGGGTSITSFTNSIGADVLLNNTANFFDGPTVAQGTTGTFFASGQVTVIDTASSANYLAKLWDGTTVIDSAVITTPSASLYMVFALSGVITNPAGNIRISVKDQSSTSGKIIFNASGASKDSTVTVLKIA